MIWKYLEQNVLFPKDLNWVQHRVSRIVRWPTTVTAITNTSRQNQKVHGKSKKLTAKAKSSRQKQKAHGKTKKLTAKAKISRQNKNSRQNQKAHGKTKSSRQNQKDKKIATYGHFHLFY